MESAFGCTRAEMLAELSVSATASRLAATHGKTTTTA